MLARFALPTAATLVLLSAAGVAHADDNNKALATELFAKGNKKLEAGKCDQAKISDRPLCEEAREHFQKAFEIYPQGLGALRNLAYVERGLGRYASAARRFRELQQKAPNDPNPKRHIWAEYATKELEVIEPLIPHLTVQPPADLPDGMTITVDDKQLPPPVWGTPIEVDPGPHKIRAEKPGAAPFTSEVTLAEKDAKSVDVEFVKTAPPPPPSPPVGPPRAEPKSRVVPLVVAGVGAAAVLVGLGFGYAAISGKQDACGDGKLCEPEGLSSARSYAVTSNIVSGIGAAVMVSGVAWYFLTPSTQSNTTTGIRFVPFAGAGALGGALMGRFE